MASIIAAGTTSGTAINISGDTSGNLAFTTQAGTYTQTVPNATGTVMVSGNMPAFSAYLISNQFVTSSTFTKVTFDGEVFDTNNNFASSRFTPTVAGYYQINACLSPASSTTYTMIRLYKNGSYFYSGGAGNNVSNSPSNVQGLLYMNGTTDYLEIYTYLIGTTPQIQSGSDTTFFNGVMVRGV